MKGDVQRQDSAEVLIQITGIFFFNEIVCSIFVSPPHFEEGPRNARQMLESGADVVSR